MSVVCIVAFACKQLCSLTLRKLDHLLVYWVKVHPSSFLTGVSVSVYTKLMCEIVWDLSFHKLQRFPLS